MLGERFWEDRLSAGSEFSGVFWSLPAEEEGCAADESDCRFDCDDAGGEPPFPGEPCCAHDMLLKLKSRNKVLRISLF
jgi:hypothetical protein